MKNKIGRKQALLALMMASALLLSSCYMSPTDITDTSGGLPAGTGNFATLAPTASPSPAPTAVPTTQANGGVGQVNWDDFGNNSATNAPSVTQAPQQNITPTNAPTNPSATTVAPVDDSGVLRSGSKGDAVKQLQERLKKLGWYTGSVDGEYGTGTVNAVKAFQSANKLTADGIAGEQTQGTIYSYYAVSKSDSSDSNSSSNSGSSTTPKPTARVTAAPHATATPNLSNARFLKVGMTGSDVRQVQNRLISLGYLSGSADGNYGAATETAVKAFQKKAKEWDDGIAGPKTQEKLYSSSAPKASSVAAAVGESLKEGMNGDGVRAMQKQLIALGYLSGSADGDFGAGTKTAVTAFQQNNGLTADGIAGTATLNKLYSSDAVKASGTPASGTTAPVASSGYTTLRQGDEGDNVKKLQQKLKDLGYYTGTVDGKYGAGTVTAVQTFQSMNGITADGIAGPATQRLLYGDTTSGNTIIGSLKKFDEGPNVSITQYTLYELGYYQDPVNGIFGDSTYNAVREFQMVNGLTVDGVAGKTTLDLLFSAFAKTASSTSVTYTTLMKGDEGEDVALMQAMLNQYGYLVSAPTGVFDDETESALKSFQQYNGLSPDGIAGATTQEKLFNEEEAVRNPLAN